jgi:hypothetical protein
MAQISVTRGLAELKLLDSRITSSIQNAMFVGVVSGNRLNTSFNLEAFEKNAKASYQSITDLINRRNTIKVAIITSNAVTNVSIGGVTMTVAEAIERKNSIGYEKQLYSKLRYDLANANSSMEKNNAVVESRLDKTLESLLGTASKDKTNEVKAISENFLKENSYSLINPLDAEDIIKELEARISQFESEVDFVLSESNARTLITIPD